MKAKAKTLPQTLEVAFYAILFLFFLELLSDFIEAIYAFGLLGTSLPPEMVSVLLLFSPLALLLFRDRLPASLLLAVGGSMLLCRALEPALDTRSRMLVAGVGTACFLFFFPAWLARRSGSTKAFSLMLSMGLALSVAVSILFRVLGSGSDLSTAGSTQAVGWLLAIVAGFLLFWMPGLRSEPMILPGDANQSEQPARWLTVGLSLGIMGVLVLFYFAFASPNVIARWTGASYTAVVTTTLIGLFLFTLLVRCNEHTRGLLSKPVLMAWNLVFVLTLTLTPLAHQVLFPTDPGAYPLPEPVAASGLAIPLVAMLLLSPVLLLNFWLFTKELAVRRVSYRSMGISFIIAAFLLLLMSFAQIFTTVYDYLPIVGPWFRDKFWLVFLIAGLSAALPLFLVPRPTFTLAPLRAGRAFPALVLLVGIATGVGLLTTAARPPAPPSTATSLHVLTYNVQQGYSQGGRKNYQGQLDLIRQIDPDVIGLQECDTNRIANGNSDLVRYLADRLDMYSYYGPRTVVGTFGIALLSRFPIQDPRTFYMYSEGEQTATIEAQITAGAKTFHVFVTHLGNDGPIVQQEAILQEATGKENVILVGDFNFRPDTEQYRLTTEVLADSWLLRWPAGVDGQGQTLDDRIDHIFVSPGTAVSDSRYLDGPQSDHPALVTTVEW